MERWHVLFTKPKKEELVFGQLLERGLEVYYPYLQFDRGYHRGIGREAFFPNYLFCKVNLASSTATGLNWLVGLRSIVHFGNEPAIVPEPVIQDMQTRLKSTSEKVMRKAEWLFHPGQSVSIVEGPFQGYAAIFQKELNGNERVQVLLQLLGTWIRADVNIDQVMDRRAA